MSKSTPTTEADIQEIALVALIDHRGQVLIARRPSDRVMGGLWEFPGGKIRAGESPATAAARELHEEIGVHVDPGTLTLLGSAVHDRGSIRLRLHLHSAQAWRGAPRSCEGQEIQWVGLDQLSRYPMPPANRALIELLRL